MESLKDPYTHLLANLSGVTKPPKAHQAVQEWQTELVEHPETKAMVTNFQLHCEPLVAPAWVEWKKTHAVRTKNPDPNFHARITMEKFIELVPDKAARAEYSTRAKEQSAAAKLLWEQALKREPSTDPVDRQT